MSVSWGKFLVRDIVVGVGYTLVWFEGGTPRSATIPAGTYSTVLEILAALVVAIDAEIAPSVSHAYVSEVGIVSIQIGGITAINWSGTADVLSELLGFDESEVVVSWTITASGQHRYGWYPGAITYGYQLSRGAGIVFGTRWVPQDSAIRTVSGSGRQRTIAPGRLRRLRRLRFDLLSLAEVRDHEVGIDSLQERFLTKRLRWYPDRSVGTPDVPGVSGDPQTDLDTDCDYWIVTLAEQPVAAERQENPDFFTIDLALNGEPPS